jgi:hypothetical protein
LRLVFKLKYLRLLLLSSAGKKSLFGVIGNPKKIVRKIKSKGLRNSFSLFKAVVLQRSDINAPFKANLQNFKSQLDLMPYGSSRFNTRLDPNRKRSVFMITDSLSEESLFGGVLTSLLFCLTLCERTNRDLTIITTQSMSKLGDLTDFLRLFKKENRVHIQYLYRPQQTADPITISKNDIFVPTSSWTCLQAISSFAHKQIFYILQEDERLFFPSGDKSNLAFQAMNNQEINFIINTECLRTYLIKSDFQHLDRNSVSFEPSFEAVCSRTRSPSGIERKKVKKVFTFYARPNHDRNMYLTGVLAIQEALANGVLNQNDWEIHFIGINNSNTDTDLTFVPIIQEKMEYSQYIDYLQNVDIGMALMASPHPGYPALDFAAAGAKSITNFWPGKMKFELFSDSVFVADGTSAGITSMIEKAIHCLQNETDLGLDQKIKSPYADSWDLNFERAVKFVEKRTSNV